MIAFPGEALQRLLEVFDRLEVPYMISGSGASSMHGLVRTTGDLDVVAKIAVEHVTRSLPNFARISTLMNSTSVRPWSIRVRLT